MLNKELCIKCNNDKVGCWTASDDGNWDNGMIWCPYASIRQDSIDSPPEHCPYKLEHIVLNQNAE